MYLDLGEVRNLARVHLNGSDMGIVWTAPWRVDVTSAMRSERNVLEVDVVNLWVNRLIGDASLPREKRLTTTNAQGLFNSAMPLLPSGLLGPVRLLTTQPGLPASNTRPIPRPH